MGNVDTGRLLDARLLHLEGAPRKEMFPIVTNYLRLRYRLRWSSLFSSPFYATTATRGTLSPPFCEAGGDHLGGLLAAQIEQQTEPTAA